MTNPDIIKKIFTEKAPRKRATIAPFVSKLLLTMERKP